VCACVFACFAVLSDMPLGTTIASAWTRKAHYPDDVIMRNAIASMCTKHVCMSSSTCMCGMHVHMCHISTGIVKNHSAASSMQTG
jgi:hypothetical protein